MLGGDEIYAALSEQLGVGMNETTADGTITLEHAECLAACDYAPVVTVNYEFFDNQTRESATGLVDQLRAGERPLPTRGAPLCTFKEISRQIAGFVDDDGRRRSRPTGTGAPTEVGVRLARSAATPRRPTPTTAAGAGAGSRRRGRPPAERPARAGPSADDAP